MNRGDVINIGHAAGFDRAHLSEDSALSLLTLLERFAVEAQRREREACEKACEELLSTVSTGDEHRDGVLDCLAAIRARGNT